MKKLNLMLIGILLLSSISFAQVQNLSLEQENAILVKTAGLTPESPLYGISVYFQHLNLVFKSKEGKVRYRVELANERLAEAKLMSDKNNEKNTKKALDNYDEEILAIDEESNGLSDDEKINIQPEFRNHVETLKGVIDKIQNDGNPNNDNALKGLNNALENSDKKYEKFRLSIPTEKRPDESTMKVKENDKDLKNQEEGKANLFSIYSINNK